MRKIVLGALAHVDAGKTTLSEAILYKCNVIKKMGRIDNGDAFLDYDTSERNRGITIYNKEARFSYKNKEYIYLDTPGHIDLKNESNKALKVIDAALLIISAIDNIPSDSISLFNNLLNYNIPIIIFVNKMDIEYADKEKVLKELKEKLSPVCTSLENLDETVALNNDELLDAYLNGALTTDTIKEAINRNDVIPCIFGSALKSEGIDELLEFIDKYIESKEIKDSSLNAYIYKVTYENNEKLTHLKVLSGTLHNKDVIGNEKINEIRLYSGTTYIQTQEVEAGNICTVKGLCDISIGTYIPSLSKEELTINNLLTYELHTTLDTNEAYRKLSILNNENPELNIKVENNRLFINLSGDLQKEIITKKIKDTFNIDVSFSNPIIRYRETITKTSVGVGHFEPLRHYGEMIVELTPNEKGIKVQSLVNNNYTGTLLNYLKTYTPRGILTNSYLDNVTITIIDYKTHLKHTEGQDLIESLRRAIRHALSKNECILLEPCYLMNIQLNKDEINLVIPILNNIHSTYTIQDDSIMAKVPTKDFNDLILLLRQKLKDNLSYEIVESIYDKCSNEKEVIEKFNYDYLSDLRNPVGSVFTFNGAGHYIDKDEVESMMHLKLSDYFKDIKEESMSHNTVKVSEDELKRVWDNLYKPKERIYKKKVLNDDENIKPIEISYKPLIYLVDGYNLMYSIPEFKDISTTNFLMAREKTIDLVCDFKGYVNAEVVLVFDAYKMDYVKPEVMNSSNITIVYTKTRQTADTYIEDKAKELSKDYKVISVTSDYLEQLRAFSKDSLRLSSSEFLRRYQNFKKQLNKMDNVSINKPFKDLRKLLEEDIIES